MNITYIYLIIFGCIAYLIVTDESIAKAVVFIVEIVKNKFLIFKWWFIHNPKTPWARYSMYRNSMKMAEELMKEFEDRDI
jgi:hypothetical protein